MTTGQNKKWAVAFGLAMFTLITSASLRAEICSGNHCKLANGFFEYSAVTGYGLLFTLATPFSPFVVTSDATSDSHSKYFSQAVKDDAAAYLATDGDFDGPMLESAWRRHLEQHADLQPSKLEFAHMVLATFG
jgi:uncharacterized protein (TIGR02448 family)